MYDLSDIKDLKGMHIAHLNARSIVNKWDVIKAQFVDNDLHVIGFSETWLHYMLPSSHFTLSKDYDFIRQNMNWMVVVWAFILIIDLRPYYTMR